MVSEEDFAGKGSYKCDDCGFHYAERETAERCEEFCRKNGACSGDITKNSLERKGFI
jgi:hypothetical protein